MYDNATKAFLETFCGDGKGPVPEKLGTRFDKNGNFLPEPGNTIVCHVVPGSKTETAIEEIRDRLQALDTEGRFTWLPVSSYHMTVFQGTIEGRRTPPYWPQALPLDAPIDATTEYFIKQLADFPSIEPFAIKLDCITPHGLTVCGATSKDEAILRNFRDLLADRLGYRHPDHDTYSFHITLAYITRWLPPHAHISYFPALKSMAEKFSHDIPLIELGSADFCTFDDMNHFEPVLKLS